MQIKEGTMLDFDDVLLQPMVSDIDSRSQVSLRRNFKFRHSNKIWSGVPVMAANMTTVGTLEAAKTLQEHSMVTALHKFYPLEFLQKKIDEYQLLPQHIGYTTGIREEDYAKLKDMKSRGMDKNFDFIVVDVPNGYIKRFGEECLKIRNMFPEHIIVAGNVCTENITEKLILDCGVDIVKSGIGGGKQCTTRFMTGVGMPQLSVVMDTANAAHGIGGQICSDGGCKTVGDIAKAFCAGADFVMVGTMLAGHYENTDELYNKKTNETIELSDAHNFEEHVLKKDYSAMTYGMSSEFAMKKFYGKVDSYRASEGLVSQIEYKGKLTDTIQQITGGLRSTGTYIGAQRIKEFSKRATFIRVNRLK